VAGECVLTHPGAAWPESRGARGKALGPGGPALDGPRWAPTRSRGCGDPRHCVWRSGACRWPRTPDGTVATTPAVAGNASPGAGRWSRGSPEWSRSAFARARQR